jgi:hypothetical protein
MPGLTFDQDGTIKLFLSRSRPIGELTASLVTPNPMEGINRLVSPWRWRIEV